MLTRLTILKAGLVIWIVWHAGFAYLATFAPELGATIVGWSTPDVWGDELRAMSKQYGMVMFLLAGVYLIMLIDPLRYLSLIWIAVGEQLLGIAYGVYIFAFLGQLTEFQLTIQFLTNAVLIVGMVVLWLGLRRQPNRA
ncbi:MAG: hypothetical protein ROR55_19205 [Devosia sp.]